MYAGDSVTDESERTAFRKAEKKYKLYYDPNTKSSKKNKQPRQVDLTEVIDFKSILESFNRNGEVPAGVSFLAASEFHLPVFCLDNRPGFYFIPGALCVEEQCRWIRDSLTSFPQPPNRTNHSAIYGSIQDLFVAAKNNKILVENDDSVDNVLAFRWKSSEEHNASSRGNTCKSTPASALLRKLRWSTLGLQFDWSKRNYNIALPHKKIPDPLCQLAKKMAFPAMPLGEEFQPEAAIVNYFGTGDMLGGHLDDMEADWSKPIFGLQSHFSAGGQVQRG